MQVRTRPSSFPDAVFSLALLVAVSALAPAAARADHHDPNPPAPGFLLEESHAEALEIADRVMDRLGGRAALDRTRFVTWKFFGRRFHVWDRHSGDIRVEGTDRESGETYLVLMNLDSKKGRAWREGAEVEGEALGTLLELGESAWINDSYWLFMPYKLKDTGVVLRYVGEGTMLDGGTADVLELTFREVGKTPENRYHVYVGRDSDLVEQWDFYTRAEDEEPRFRIPWRNWRQHGDILLSDDRGRGKHSDLAVFDELPSAVFTSPEPVDLDSFPRAASSRSLTGQPIYAVEGEVVKPALLESAAPQYPEAARDAGTEGLVVVKTVIGADGSIRDAWVDESLTEELDAAALEAIRAWRFEPATLGGEAVPVYYTLTVNFQLDGEPAEDSD